MFTWNDPYVLAIILGLIAVALFHFDQKKKENEVDKIAYTKVFVLVAGSIALFHYFVLSDSKENLSLASAPLATPNVEIEAPVTSVTPTTTINNVVTSQSPIPTSLKQIQSSNSAFTSVINTSSTLAGLKIKEGPPNF
jgi:hypothetical protein